MSTSLQNRSNSTPFIAIGLSSFLVAGVMTISLLQSAPPESAQVVTGEVELTKSKKCTYEDSVSSGFIAEHIGTSSGMAPEEFAEYSAKLAETLTKLTPEQRSDVFQGVTAYEEAIFASK